jgi:hypothetical protein
MQRNNTTGYRGVSRRKQNLTRPFTAQIRHLGTYIHLGYFETAEDAARAFDRKSREVWGDFARLNFPDEHDA